MANTILTSSVIARAALATLYEQCVMLPLVYADASNEFQAGRGATVTIRKPATFTANDYNGSTITVQNATQTGVNVTLDKHKDVSFAVPSKALTLDITSFSEEFLTPAMEAMALAVDRAILAFRTDITQTVGSGVAPLKLWSNPRSLIDAGVVLDNAFVPAADRSAVVDPTFAGEWLKDDLLNRADASGDTAALRTATLANSLFGFRALKSQNVKDSKAVCFHRTAVAFATAPLALPAGAAMAEYVTYKGISMRLVAGYNMDTKSDVYSLDMLFGVKTLDATRACLIEVPA